MTADLVQRLRDAERDNMLGWAGRIRLLLREAADALDSHRASADSAAAYLSDANANLISWVKRGVDAEARLAAAEEQAKIDFAAAHERLAAAERVVDAADLLANVDEGFEIGSYLLGLRSELAAYRKVTEAYSVVPRPALHNADCLAVGDPMRCYCFSAVGFTGDPQAPVELMKEVQRATEGGPYPADLNFSDRPRLRCPYHDGYIDEHDKDGGCPGNARSSSLREPLTTEDK